ncbi:MAG: H-NS family nucleoid-associated regulatory protein [Pseudorhodobacter sp.]
MDINLNEMSLKQLRDLQGQVAKAIGSYEDRRKKAAIAELDEKARELGFSSLAELTGGQALRKRAAVAPKYANPADPSQTWSGRGRKPGWFIAALAAGKSPDDLAI